MYQPKFSNSAFDQKKEAKFKGSNNPFALLGQNFENGTNNGSNKNAKIKKESNGMALKIKQQEAEREARLSNYTPATNQFTYPLVQLTTWKSKKQAPSPIFDDYEDEMQIGPEMRQVYNYLEEVYQENQHRAIYNYDSNEEYDEDAAAMLSDDSDFE